MRQGKRELLMLLAVESCPRCERLFKKAAREEKCSKALRYGPDKFCCAECGYLMGHDGRKLVYGLDGGRWHNERV